MSERSHVPRELERDVLVEAGHRCAIPTCRQTPVEIAHIEAWSGVKEHKFDNLIALCPTCHTRYDKGEIDRKSMRQYKANLGILNSRYGDFERRVLSLFAAEPTKSYIDLELGSLNVDLMYLIQDGMIVERQFLGRSQYLGRPVYRRFELTDQGREFINHWMAAEQLE